MKLENRLLVFWPVNDSTAEPNSGTHWTLLVYSARDETFFHYDSVPGSPNGPVAEHAADVIWNIMLRLNHRDVTTERKPIKTPKLVSQIGDADCGVYVCYLSNAIALAGSCVDLSTIATPKAIRAFRGYMNINLSRAREEYAQLIGNTVVGNQVDPALDRPGASKAANAPRAEDLENVKGTCEDDEEAEKAAARAARLKQRAERAAAASTL